MALVFIDLAQETTNTTGTGTLTLAGAVTGFQSLAGIGNGNTSYFRIKSGVDSEVFLGTWSTGGTLTRDTVQSSIIAGTAGTTKITVVAGSTVTCCYPAEKTVILDGSGNATALGIPASFVGTNITGTATSLSIGGTSALATNVAGGVTGSIPYQSNTNVTAMTAAGTTGQVLTTVTTGAAPTWQAPTGGGVASVTGTSPISSSGGTTPDISISAATTSNAGSMSSADKNKLDAISGTNTGDQTTITGNAGSATNISGGVLGAVPYQSGVDTTAFTSTGTSGQVLTSAGTGTPIWTNAPKLIPRVYADTSNSATPTLNANNYDMWVITGQTLAITSFTTNLSGTPVNGQKLWIAITGTAAVAITWGASFESSTVLLPTTTVTTARMDVGFIYDSATTLWRCVAVA